jgi:hypothetical protein
MDNIQKVNNCTNESQIGICLEECGCGLIEVLSQHVARGTEEYHREKIRIYGAPAEVWNKHLQKTCLELHLYASPVRSNYLKKTNKFIVNYNKAQYTTTLVSLCETV